MTEPDLSRPSEAPLLFDKLMQQALLEVSMLSQMRAARIGKDVTASKPTSSPPRGMDNELEGVVRVLRDAYEAATDNLERLQLINRAQALVREVKYSPDRSLWRGTCEWKTAIASDVRKSNVLARVYSVSPSYVRKLRRLYKAGRLCH